MKKKVLSQVLKQTKSQYQKGYEQENPGIFIRFSPEQMVELRKEAHERRWSLSNLCSYCIEQYLELPPSSINRR